MRDGGGGEGKDEFWEGRVKTNSGRGGVKTNSEYVSFKIWC